MSEPQRFGIEKIERAQRDHDERIRFDETYDLFTKLYVVARGVDRVNTLETIREQAFEEANGLEEEFKQLWAEASERSLRAEGE